MMDIASENAKFLLHLQGGKGFRAEGSCCAESKSVEIRQVSQCEEGLGHQRFRKVTMHPPLGSALTAELRRRHASILIGEGVNIFDVARSFAISPRVLLAWLDFEGSKWENDPYVGRGPGTDEKYDGAWPTEVEELDRYMTMGLRAKHFDGEALRNAYLKHRKGRLDKQRKSRKT